MDACSPAHPKGLRGLVKRISSRRLGSKDADLDSSHHFCNYLDKSSSERYDTELGSSVSMRLEDTSHSPEAPLEGSGDDSVQALDFDNDESKDSAVSELQKLSVPFTVSMEEKLLERPKKKADRSEKQKTPDDQSRKKTPSENVGKSVTGNEPAETSLDGTVLDGMKTTEAACTDNSSPTVRRYHNFSRGKHVGGEPAKSQEDVLTDLQLCVMSMLKDPDESNRTASTQSESWSEPGRSPSQAGDVSSLPDRSEPLDVKSLPQCKDRRIHSHRLPGAIETGLDQQKRSSWSLTSFTRSKSKRKSFSEEKEGAALKARRPTIHRSASTRSGRWKQVDIGYDYPNRMRRSRSVPNLSLPPRSCLKKDKATARKSLPGRVSFSQIHVREYERVVGDNPSVTGGPPIALGWAFDPDEKEFSVDAFESLRPPRRKKEQFLMPSRVRTDLLIDEWGFPYAEVRRTVAEISDLRRQREKSAHRPKPLDNVEEAVEAFVRRLHRLRSGTTKEQEQENLWKAAMERTERGTADSYPR